MTLGFNITLIVVGITAALVVGCSNTSSTPAPALTFTSTPTQSTPSSATLQPSAVESAKTATLQSTSSPTSAAPAILTPTITPTPTPLVMTSITTPTHVPSSTATPLLATATPLPTSPSPEPTRVNLSIPTPAPTSVVPKGIPRGWRSAYTQIYFTDFELPGPSQSTTVLPPGLQFPPFESSKNASITTDSEEVITGLASIRLTQYGALQTNSNLLPLSANTYYMVEFDYKILNQDAAWGPFDVWVKAVGSENLMRGRPTLPNMDMSGTFSAGVLTPSGSIFQFHIRAEADDVVIIDNLRIFRQDTTPVTTQPVRWEILTNKPYPRLGNYHLFGSSSGVAGNGWAEGAPYTYTVNEIEERWAMADVLVGPGLSNQTRDPDLIRRLRELNPDIVILPYHNAGEGGFPCEPVPRDAIIDLDWEWCEGVSDEWWVRDTDGNPVPNPVWANGRHMNISEFAPIVNGQTFHDYDIEWVVTQVLASGVWDGMFYDNLNGRINPFILNANDNSLLNYDANGNGLRDESPAWVSDKTRTAFIKYLQRIRDQVGDLEIIMGNAGPYPDIYLAPYVNGYVFEGWNAAWFAEWVSPPSEPEWRRSLDAYFTIQEETVWPHINIIQGSGMVWTGSIPNPDRKYLEPTPRDLEQHRFTLGTTLLGDGFYEYDLFTARSAPFWFDEFTVDENGVAIEDRRYKGYLGMALGDASELASPSTEIWSENFETGALPPEMWAQAGVYVSQLEDDIIDGVGTLVIDNPDHARGASIEAGTITDRIALGSDKTYVVEFDWKILETIDQSVHATLRAPSGQEIFWWWPGVVAGDAGKARFHATLAGSDEYSFVVQLLGGGGKIAIDNIRIVEGGAGPWRRDFENGFVLVNPIKRPYTFTAKELAGDLNRTGIRRILGTQASDVNNGQAVSDSLTLKPFDAIILLADHIPES